jgi:aspartate ammonia-lyase
VLTTHCVRGITANTDQLARTVAESIGLVTALSPLLGYERATAIAQEAQLTGRGAVELVLEKGLLTREQIGAALHPHALTGLHAPHVITEDQHERRQPTHGRAAGPADGAD